MTDDTIVVDKTEDLALVQVQKPELTQYGTDMTGEQAKQLQAYNIDSNMRNIFGLTGNQLAKAQGVANMYQIKHGLTATIPIICKNASCPYEQTCVIPPQDRMFGGRCLQEIGAMVARFEGLCRELAVTDDDVVDSGLVKDVVDIEMMMLRADHKLAASGDVLADTILFVDSKGNEHHGDVVDPIIQLKMSLLDKKMKLLEKLNSTRKDKADEMKKKKDPTVKSASLMQRVKLIQQEIRQKTAGGQQTVTESDTIEVELSNPDTGEQEV